MPVPFANDPRCLSLYEKEPELGGDKIRLVTVHPGHVSEDIRCDLVVSNSDAVYEAVSYTWGFDGDPSIYDVANGVFKRWSEDDIQRPPPSWLTSAGAQTIMVNGIQIPVMPNLKDALQYMRRAESPRTLWVDYLCINQNSIKDKNNQVGRMGDIYRQAKQVLVWLGLEDDGTPFAVSELQKIATDRHIDQIYPGSSPAQILKKLDPILNLLGRPWFCRMWVIQEVSLAKRVQVQVGRSVIPWEMFLKAREIHLKHVSCCGFVFGSSEFRNDTRDLYWISQAVPDLTEAWPGSLGRAVQQFRYRTASDPRDKIFSLLSLINIDSQPSNADQKTDAVAEADYGLSVKDVFEKATLSEIYTLKRLNILAMSGAFKNSNSNTPFASWIADFEFRQKEAVWLCNTYDAALSTTPTITHCFPDILRCAGIPFQSITRIGRNSLQYRADKFSPSSITLSHRAITEWESIVASLDNAATPYAGSVDKTDAFWHTLWLGYNNEAGIRCHPRDGEDYRRWRTWLDAAERGSLRRRFLETENVKKQQITFLNAEKTFFVTGGGYMGVAYPSAEPGDTVCVLFGAHVPFLLRAQNEVCRKCREPCFRIVGFAYVHGIMDGEVVKEQRRGTFKYAGFCLK